MHPQLSQFTTIQKLLGSGLVFLGAILFSAKAIMVKLAYNFEVDSVSLLALRMIFALPFYLAIGYWGHRRASRKKQILTRKDGWKIFFLGVAGYYLASLFDFLGLQYITAGLERLILFVYPTIVVMLSYFYGKKISAVVYLALVLTYLGIGIACWGSGVSGQNENLALGGFLIFLAAFTFAIYIFGSGNLIPRVGVLRYTALAMSAATLGILLQHGIFQQFQLFHFAPEVYHLAFLMAVFCTVLPSLLVSEGIHRVGSNQAAVIGSIGPVSTIILAYIFLNETFGLYELIGTGFVIGGVLLISLKDK